MSEDSKNADSAGRCKYTIQVPDDAKEGNATLVGSVREGGKVNRQEIPVQIVEKEVGARSPRENRARDIESGREHHDGHIGVPSWSL